MESGVTKRLFFLVFNLFSFPPFLSSSNRVRDRAKISGGADFTGANFTWSRDAMERYIKRMRRDSIPSTLGPNSHIPHLLLKSSMTDTVRVNDLKSSMTDAMRVNASSTS